MESGEIYLQEFDFQRPLAQPGMRLYNCCVCESQIEHNVVRESHYAVEASHLDAL